MSSTKTSLENVSLGHYKLHAGLQTFMKVIGTSGHFSYSEELEKRVKLMKLYLDEYGDSAYTDFKAVHVGLAFPYFDGNLDENYVTCKVIIGHEVAHIRLTSKKAWDTFCQTSRGKYKSFANLATDVLNIVEDGRIEYHMAKVSKFLMDGFFILRQKMATNIQDSFDEIEDSIEMGPYEKINHIRNAILYMVCTLRLPIIKNEELLKYVEEIYPFIIYSRTTKSTYKAVVVTKKIMNIISPLLEEMNKSEDDRKIDSKFSSQSKGSASPTQDKNLDGMGSNDELDKHIPKELKELLNELSKKVKDELQEEPGDEDGEELSKSTKEEIMKEITAHSKEKKEELDKEIKEKVEKVKKQLIEESSTEEILNDFLKPDEKNAKQESNELKETAKMNELKPTLDKHLHANCKAVFKEKKEMETFLPYEYNELLQPFNTIIKKAAKELEKMSEETIRRNLRNKRQGKLDKKSLIRAGAFNDPKSFIRKKVDLENLFMDIMLLVDVSGSNSVWVDGSLRYELNRIIAMTLHEILKRAKFNHSIWSFEEGRDYEELFAPMVDFSNCLQKDAGLYLKDIDAYRNNRDGFAISYAGEYLHQNSNSSKKLLIVLSDGVPHATGYGGDSAHKDVRNMINDLEKKGVKTFGIFSGDVKENKVFGEMYENAIFANNESLKDMPKTLKDLLLKEFKEHIKAL